MVVSKIKPIKVVHDDFIYYKYICPNCKKEIRAHSDIQCKFNYELHLMECRKRK